MTLKNIWDWYSISYIIPISEVYDNPNETWNKNGLSQNKGITIDLIHNLVLPNARSMWHWFDISQNISVSEVYKYPDEIWHREGLSQNKGITIDLVHNLILPNTRGQWD